MDTVGPGFFQVCLGAVALVVALPLALFALLVRFGGRTQGDAEAAYTEAAALREMRWLAGEGDTREGDRGEEVFYTYETDPRTGRVTVLPPTPAASAPPLRTPAPPPAGGHELPLPPGTLLEWGGVIVTRAEYERYAPVFTPAEFGALQAALPTVRRTEEYRERVAAQTAQAVYEWLAREGGEE